MSEQRESPALTCSGCGAARCPHLGFMKLSGARCYKCLQKDMMIHSFGQKPADLEWNGIRWVEKQNQSDSGA